jgi:hypothetical protein
MLQHRRHHCAGDASNIGQDCGGGRSILFQVSTDFGDWTNLRQAISGISVTYVRLHQLRLADQLAGHVCKNAHRNIQTKKQLAEMYKSAMPM